MEYPNNFKCKVSLNNYHDVLLETTPDVREFGLFDNTNAILSDFLDEDELKTFPKKGGVYEADVEIKWINDTCPMEAPDYYAKFIFSNFVELLAL